jgi:transposase
MQTVTTIGLDIAKSVFQVHGDDTAGQVVIRRKLKRRYVLAFFQKLPPCLVGIEASSSHYWARELQALGHTVRQGPRRRIAPGITISPTLLVRATRRSNNAAICCSCLRPVMARTRPWGMSAFRPVTRENQS